MFCTKLVSLAPHLRINPIEMSFFMSFWFDDDNDFDPWSQQQGQQPSSALQNDKSALSVAASQQH
jgi:hypothetical protein